ncbi:mediator complex subunit MED14-domain-containing protein [Phlyctochytrium arcticum]|nr:mediator complex subunit MED14-domain-containing protein [Phlyctochytrium arcticum]
MSLGDEATLVSVVWMNPVPLNDLCARVIRSCYCRLQDYRKTISTLPPAQRRSHLALEIFKQRLECHKLLVAIYWIKKCQEWQHVLNAHGFIDHQSGKLKKCADTLHNTVHQFRHFAENANPDMETGVRMLSSDACGRLSGVLQGTFRSDPPSLPNMPNILNMLEELIYRRLEQEIVPEAIRKGMIIANGCALFRTQGQFEVAVTLIGQTPSLPWRIVEFKLLSCSSNRFKDICPDFLDSQMQRLLFGAQSLIEQVHKRKVAAPAFAIRADLEAKSIKSNEATLGHGLKNSKRHTHMKENAWQSPVNKAFPLTVLEDSSSPLDHFASQTSNQASQHKFAGLKLGQVPLPQSDPNENATGYDHSSYSLLHLFYFAEMLALRRVLQILHLQATYLARTRWRDMLGIEFRAHSLKISFWEMAIAAPDPKTVPAGYKAPRQCSVLEFALYGHDRPKNRHFDDWKRAKLGGASANCVNFDLVRASVFGDTSCCELNLRVDCYDVIPGPFSSTTNVPVRDITTGRLREIRLDSSKLDLEDLLNDVVRYKSHLKLQQISSSLQHIFISPTHANINSNAGSDSWGISMENEETEEMQILYNHYRFLTFAINGRTGRVSVTYTGGILQKPPKQYLARIANSATQGDMQQLTSDVFRLHSFACLEKISRWALHLKLRPVPKGMLTLQGEFKMMANQPEENLYLRLPGSLSAWIFIAAASRHEWIGDLSSSLAAQTSADALHFMNKVVYRVWLLCTDSDSTVTARDDKMGPRVIPLRRMRNNSGREKDKFATGEITRDDARVHDHGVGIRMQDTADPSNWTDDLYWDTVTPNDLCQLESNARLFLVYHNLTEHLRQNRIPFDLGSEEILQLPALSAELGNLQHLCIRVPIEYLATLSTLQLDDEDCPTFPFGDILVTIVSDNTAGMSSGLDQAPSSTMPVGDRTSLQAVYVNCACSVKESADFPHLTSMPSKNLIFDTRSRSLSLRFEVPEETLDCGRLFRANMTSYINLALLSQQLIYLESKLKSANIKIVFFDFQNLLLSFSANLEINIRWENEQDMLSQSIVGRFRIAINEIGSDILREGATPRVTGVLLRQMSMFLEDDLNARLNISSSLLKMWHVFPLLELLSGMERRRSTSANDREQGKPLTILKVKSLTCLQVKYSNVYGVDYIFHDSGKFGVYDAARLPGQLCGEADMTSYGDCRTSFTPIPQFYAGAGLTFALANLVENPEIPFGTQALPLPYGVVFDIPLLNSVVEKVDAHLSNIATLIWFIQQAQKRLPETDVKDVKTETETSVIIRTEARGFYVTINTAQRWRVATLGRPAGEISGENIRSDLWKCLSDALTTKLNALPPRANIQPFLTTFLDLLLLPRDPMADLLRIVEFEKKQHDEHLPLLMEWCLILPGNVPSYLGTPGSPGIKVELEKQRISVVFRFKEVATQKTALFPILYNANTGVLCPWEATSDNDFTQLGEMNNLLYQRLRDDWTKQNFLSLLAKISLTSEIPESMGGPGKLFPIVKHICKQRMVFLEA